MKEKDLTCVRNSQTKGKVVGQIECNLHEKGRAVERKKNSSQSYTSSLRLPKEEKGFCKLEGKG